MLAHRIEILVFFFSVSCFIYSCASSDQKQQEFSYPNQVTLTAPGNTAHAPGKVFIDSVRQVSQNTTAGLLISGSFSDGCTHLQSVSHNIKDDEITVEISAWRNKDAVCTQALVPFSFIYEKLTSQALSSHSQVIINGKTYSF